MTPLLGILNIDKPAGISSAQVVTHVKRLLPRGTKVGHAGTLDPFATGVLLVLVGKATKWCESLMNQPKQYETTIKFGATTETDDPNKPEAPYPDAREVSRADVDRVVPSFVGEIQQRPPAYSAIKVEGRRAYDIARKGHDLELQARTVRVDRIEVIDFAWPFLQLRIDCGRGTYIRSLARDIGETLKVGGYLTALRRTRSGEFDVASGVTLETIGTDGIERFLLTDSPRRGEGREVREEEKAKPSS